MKFGINMKDVTPAVMTEKTPIPVDELIQMSMDAYNDSMKPCNDGEAFTQEDATHLLGGGYIGPDQLKPGVGFFFDSGCAGGRDVVYGSKLTEIASVKAEGEEYIAYFVHKEGETQFYI